ncbi:MAG: RNA-binding protein [Candidatus Thiodiazotropha sp.]
MIIQAVPRFSLESIHISNFKVSLFQTSEMYQPEIKFGGVEGNFVNFDRLQRTVRLTPSTVRSRVSTGEMLNSLIAAGIEPTEVEGIYKVSADDSSYTVALKYIDTVDRLISYGTFRIGEHSYEAMRMNEQVVTLRVHWLPLYYDESILKEILSEYGEVLEIKMLKTAHGQVVVLDGVREVRLKVAELKKHLIPHIVRFNSGQAILLTMQGRPPYCLKCKSTGHVRQRCPKKTTYATVVNTSAPPDPTPAPAPVTPVPRAAELPSAASAGGGTESQFWDAASGKGDAGQEEQEMESYGDGSLKRPHEQVDEETLDSSFITPNHTAKPRPPCPRSTPIKTQNTFNLVMSVDDIMS